MWVGGMDIYKSNTYCTSLGCPFSVSNFTFFTERQTSSSPETVNQANMLLMTNEYNQNAVNIFFISRGNI